MEFKEFLHSKYVYPATAFSFGFLYALFKWGFPWRLAFLVGVLVWSAEIFTHRAFIGSE